MNRFPLLLGALFYLLYRLSCYLTGEIYLSLLIFVIPVAFLVVNLFLRRQLKYKSWFLSPFNLFIERKKYQFESEIDPVLLYEKLLEVVEASGFKFIGGDETNKRILCGTSLNFWTWGENVYIEIREKKDSSSLIQFTSVTLYGNSWNRNKNNYEAFVSSFESSLAI